MGRHYGRGMNVDKVTPGRRRLGRLTDLLRESRLRLKWFDYYYAHGGNVRLTWSPLWHCTADVLSVEEALLGQGSEEP